MNDCIESIMYKGFSIDIYQDECFESPREWENLGTMVCFHRRYSLGDKHEFSDSDDFREYLDENENKIMALPLYLYDHGGITMNTTGFSCPWDSGQVGVIYCTYEKIRKEYGIKYVTKKWQEKIRQYLINEVQTYDQYLRGEVYCYNIEDTVDSCGGFYGYDHKKSGLLEYARSAIDYEIKDRKAKHAEQLKQWIKAKVPLQYRTPLQIV